MPRLAAALVALAVILPVAGCGGSQVAYTEIKSAPPTLPIPQDAGTASSASADTSATRSSDGVKKTKTGDSTDTSSSTSTSSSSSTSTATTPATTAPSTAATTAPSTGTSGGTGGTTPASPTTAPSTGGNGGTGGATADQGLDKFCADNPGACNGGN